MPNQAGRFVSSTTGKGAKSFLSQQQTLQQLHLTQTTGGLLEGENWARVPKGNCAVSPQQAGVQGLGCCCCCCCTGSGLCCPRTAALRCAASRPRCVCAAQPSSPALPAAPQTGSPHRGWGVCMGSLLQPAPRLPVRPAAPTWTGEGLGFKYFSILLSRSQRFIDKMHPKM